jgi:hypothetical protein
MLLQDDDTIARDPVTGKITCIKVKVMGLDKPVKMWMGSRSDYEALKNKSPADTVYFFTDINTYDIYKLLDSVSSWVTNVATGNIVVPNAKHAEEADNANEAAYATNANYASMAGSASIAWEATHATNADNATNATNANSAKTAVKSDQDGLGNVISTTYGRFKDNFTLYNGEALENAQKTYQFNVDFGFEGESSSVIVTYQTGKTFAIPIFYSTTMNRHYFLVINGARNVRVVDEDVNETTNTKIYYRVIGLR